MRVFLMSVLLVAWSLLAGLSAAAGPPGVKLVISPPNLVFRIKGPLQAGAMAVAELNIQVIAAPRQPWRLTVTALGPIMSAEGARIEAGQIRWRGSPGTVFLEGVLSQGSPQLCGRGEGPKAGVLHFLVQPTRQTFAGNYNQKLLFNLSSP